MSLKDKEIVELYSHFCHNKSIPVFLKKQEKYLLEDGIGCISFDLPSPSHGDYNVVK